EQCVRVAHGAAGQGLGGRDDALPEDLATVDHSPRSAVAVTEIARRNLRVGPDVEDLQHPCHRRFGGAARRLRGVHDRTPVYRPAPSVTWTTDWSNAI